MRFEIEILQEYYEECKKDMFFISLIKWSFVIGIIALILGLFF